MFERRLILAAAWHPEAEQRAPVDCLEKLNRSLNAASGSIFIAGMAFNQRSEAVAEPDQVASQSGTARLCLSRIDMVPLI